MIKNSKQNWTVGNVVKVGFLSLTVKAAIATPGDYMPDAYILANAAGTQLYKFVPHNGLEKIDVQEARDMINDAQDRAARMADAAISKAAERNEITALFA